MVIKVEFTHASMIPARRPHAIAILLRTHDKARSIFFTAPRAAAMLRTLDQPNAQTQEAAVM